jgi:hypothetical protein
MGKTWSTATLIKRNDGDQQQDKRRNKKKFFTAWLFFI